ncbi:MAG: c-type cytochrome [Melioribacteraceae bacterium]
MKLRVLLVAFSCLIIIDSTTAQSNGQKIFTSKCTACHTIGGGNLVGPDLANVQDLRTEEWLINFIKSPQKVIDSGDSAAVALHNEFKILMPDQLLSNTEIKSIIDYIKTNSPDANNPNQKTPNQIFNASLATDSDVIRGKSYFEGESKFKNGGPSCISCHNVDNPNVLTGGLLAKDLTLAFSRLSAAGIDGILRNPPFPAMIDGFGAAPLTDQEISDLLAFFYYSNNAGVSQATTLQTQSDLLVSLIIGLDIFIAFLLIMWRRVKKRSVNFFNN